MSCIAQFQGALQKWGSFRSASTWQFSRLIGGYFPRSFDTLRPVRGFDKQPDIRKTSHDISVLVEGGVYLIKKTWVVVRSAEFI